MKVLFVFAVIIAMVSADCHQNVPYTNCGQSGDEGTVSCIQATPFPPQKGANITVDVAGTLKEAIDSGSVHINVKYMGIQLLTKTMDICTIDPTKFQCPHAAGSLDLSDTLEIPSVAPSGSYDISVKANDGNQKEIVCVSLSLNIN